jgi:hypothetical protein
MRRELQIGLILTACLAVAGERPTIGLLTEYPADASTVVRLEFRLETERALQAAEVNLAWRELAESGPQESFDRLVVIRFRGECTPPLVTALPRSLPLGLTHVSDGHVLPFVEIDCQRVLEAMDLGEWPGRFRQLEALTGRALGRVAAHEIHHVLTGSGAHDVEGLMKRSFDRRDLCGKELSFSGESVRRLKISLGTATTQTAGPLKPKTASDD